MMAKPIIMYLSMLTLSTTTVTDPGSAAGHPITNAFDYKTHTTWRSDDLLQVDIDIDAGVAGAPADYIAFANHNLSTLGARIQIKRKIGAFYVGLPDGGGDPDSDAAWSLQFSDPGAQQFWRITISDPLAAPFSDYPEIGEIYFGLRTDLPEYVSPVLDPFLSGAQVKGARLTGGHALPGSALRTHRGVLSFGAAGVDRSGLGAPVNTFLENHALKRMPFFFMLDSDDTDFSATHFLKMTDESDAARLAVGGLWNRLSLDLQVEEAAP